MSTLPQKTVEEDKVIVMACKMTDAIDVAEATPPGREKARAYGRAEQKTGEVREAVRQYRAAGGEH